jgi:predicted nuclease of predicted toxin-antitoxin system
VRILANENVAGATVQALREAGHDVAWIADDSPGDSDERVLQRAIDENRVVLTFDKDFGELAFRRGLSASGGIVLLRLQATDAQAQSRLVIAALAGREDWEGHFSVIENERIRMMPLPGL